jgi:Transposase
MTATKAILCRAQGGQKRYTERDTRRIIHFIRINPKSTFADIQRNLHIYLSHDSFSRILADMGVKNWRAKGRPFLTPEHAKLRYVWAKVYNN